MRVSIPKPVIIGKHIEKCDNNLVKTKKNTLIPRYKLSGGPVFAFSLPGGAVRTSDPVSYATGSMLNGCLATSVDLSRTQQRSLFRNKLSWT